MCFLLFFSRSHSFFTFLNAPRSVNRYPFCARWACSALLYPALLTGGGTTSWDISAMNARTAAYAICRAVSSNEGGIILSKYSSSDSVFMNGINELSGKKVSVIVSPHLALVGRRSCSVVGPPGLNSQTKSVRYVFGGNSSLR